MTSDGTLDLCGTPVQALLGVMLGNLLTPWVELCGVTHVRQRD